LVVKKCRAAKCVRQITRLDQKFIMTNLELVRSSGDEATRRKLLGIVAAAERTEGRSLPPERELTARLGIKRGRLRLLLAELEADGRIWRHVGRGTFAGRRPVQADPDLKLVCEHSSPSELLEARLVVEPELAALAATRASAAEISDLRLTARKCAGAAGFAVYERWDENLHTAIARASRNRTLIALFNGLNAVRREVIWDRLREQHRRLGPEQQSGFAAQHEAIVRAITSRDAEAARQAMREHLESFARLYSSIR
jgi:DNA-binding FadR family transcriptional regulator